MVDLNGDVNRNLDQNVTVEIPNGAEKSQILRSWTKTWTKSDILTKDKLSLKYKLAKLALIYYK